MKLKEIANITMGQSPKGSSYNESKNGVPFLQGSRTFNNLYPNIDTWCSKPLRFAEQGDILMSVRAPVGDLNLANQKICIGRGLCSINAGVYTKFIYYWLKNNVIRLNNVSPGTTFTSIRRDTLNELDLGNINLQKSFEIGEFLFRIDEKIELNNKINDNLLQLNELIYKRWFEDFNFPNADNMPYNLDNGSFKYDKLAKRKIPSNWHSVNLLDVVMRETNSQPPKSTFIYEPKEGYIRFIQNRDYNSDNYNTFIPFTNNLSIVDEFDILIDKYGDAGKTRFGLKGTYNVALAKIHVRNPNYKEYLRSYFSSRTIYNYLHNACNASTRASLNEEHIKFLNILLPDINTLEKYERIAHKLIAKIIENKNENKKLTFIRNNLMPLLLNGQITIK